jgi:hypothetical protein
MEQWNQTKPEGEEREQGNKAEDQICSAIFQI